MRLRFILVLIFLGILFNLSSHACDVESDDFYTKYPTLKPAADDPWKNRLFTKLPDAVSDQLYERSKKNFASKEDFLSAVQMTDAQQLVKMGDFVYDEHLLIGKGVEGGVYLAKHIPTGFYAAVKTPVRQSECEAFKNLGRGYAYFAHYLYTPFIMGTSLSEYYFDEERLYVRVDSQNKVSYSNWPHNLRLLDAFLAELERCVKHKGIPQELDPRSMFVIDEFSEAPKVVFVDLDTGIYNRNDQNYDPDYIPDEFCVPMFLLLGSQGSARMRKLVFPKPIRNFFERASKAEKGFVRLTEIKEARNQLMIEMQQLGYPGLSLDESSISSVQASSSSHE